MSRAQDWQDRYAAIKTAYPGIDQIDWSFSLGHDTDMFARILGDVLKSQGKRSRPGKRPSLERGEAEVQLAKILNEDYCETDFRTGFDALTRDMTVRSIAAKTGLDKMYVNRLQRGTTSPSFEAMETIAKSFGKDPSWFLEYRIAFVLLMIDKFLMSAPDTATNWYLKMKRQDGLKIR